MKRQKKKSPFSRGGNISEVNSLSNLPLTMNGSPKPSQGCNKHGSVTVDGILDIIHHFTVLTTSSNYWVTKIHSK